MEGVLLCLLSLLVILTSRWIYSWRNPKISNGKLPPGAMGFPLIGETLAFLRRHDFYEINPFVRTRMEKYGPIFKTNLLGLPTVVFTEPEVNHYIFQQEDKLFRIRYTESFRKIFGDDNIMKYHGSIHKCLKNLISNLVSPQRLKDKLVVEMDAWVRLTLSSSWSRRPSVNIKEAAADMIFEYVALKLFSYDESKEKMKLRENYKRFMEGLISFPINIPGTTYHACLRGRRTALNVIKDKYEERVASKERRNDFMDILVDELKKEDTFLSKAAIIELLFVLLFGAYETTSQTIALVVKFMAENPSVLTKLTEEHEEILKARDGSRGDHPDAQPSGVTWEEYKSMFFTHMVINETLRLANIAPAFFRIATQDVNIKGYTIPEGWMVAIVPGVAHLDPNNFENPLKFNPWRWEKEKDVHAASRKFMPFGGGLRHCVGADFAKVEIAIFIHNLVTKYRWKIIGGGQLTRIPGLMFPNGLHVRIWNKND